MGQIVARFFVLSEFVRDSINTLERSVVFHPRTENKTSSCDES